MNNSQKIFASSMNSIISSASESLLVVHRIADDWAGHAVPATPAATQLGADDRDDLDALLAQQRVGVRVAVVGEDHPRRCADEVGAAVPLRALAHVGGATGFDDAHLFH